MLTVLLVSSLWQRARRRWPATFERLPLPLHLLSGDARLLDLAMRGFLGAAWVTGLLAPPLLLLLAALQGPETTALTALALVLIRLLEGQSRARKPRSCAAGLRERGIGTGLLALLCSALALPFLSLSLVLVTPPLAAFAAITGLLLLAALVWAFWGRGRHFLRLRQPHFRVLGDNPGSLTLVAKTRIATGGTWLHLPPLGEGPVTVTAYTLDGRRFGHLPWELLRPRLRGSQAARIRLVPEAPERPAVSEAPLSMSVPEGRVLLSIRYYRPSSDRSRSPRLEAAS